MSSFGSSSEAMIKRALNKGSGEDWTVRSYRGRYGENAVRRMAKNIGMAMSVIFSPGRVDKVVCWSAFDAIWLSLAHRLFPFHRKMEITASMFIYYRSQSALKDRMKRALYGMAFRSERVRHIVVHSRVEVEEYGRLFPSVKDKFRFVPVGVSMPDCKCAEAAGEPYLFGVGYGNRDWEFLINALAGTGYKVRIACRGLRQPDCDNIEVLQNCFGEDMLREMAGAAAVIVPLRQSVNVSSGQVVFLQAMHLGVPVIISDLPAVRDYIVHGVNGLIINNTREELIGAIDVVERDAGLRNRLIENGRRLANEFYTPGGLMERLAAL